MNADDLKGKMDIEFLNSNDDLIGGIHADFDEKTVAISGLTGRAVRVSYVNPGKLDIFALEVRDSSGEVVLEIPAAMVDSELGIAKLRSIVQEWRDAHPIDQPLDNSEDRS